MTAARVGNVQYMALGILAQAKYGTMPFNAWSGYIVRLTGYSSTVRFTHELELRGLVKLSDARTKITITPLGLEQRVIPGLRNRYTFWRLPVEGTG